MAVNATPQVSTFSPFLFFSFSFFSLPGRLPPLDEFACLTRSHSIFEEYHNWGSGSNTSERVMETNATGPVTMDQLWPEGYDWIDSTY